MTVPTITDDLLAELEAECSDAYDKDFTPSLGACEVLALIARVRELEKDAGRYRWLRDRALDVEFTAPAVVMVDEKCKPKTGEVWSSAMRGEEMDTMLDQAMQADK